MVRPTKLTPRLQAKICDAIRVGCYVETAAAYCGISKDTFYRWLRKGNEEEEGIYRDFVDAVEKAIADAEFRDVMIISNAATTDWKAAAWKLERRAPDRWSRREKLSAQVEHSGQITNRTEHDIHIKQEIISDPESRELIKQLWRRQQDLKGQDH